MSSICQFCCNVMYSNEHITCDTCRMNGKYKASYKYGKLMNFKTCVTCKLPAVDPNDKWDKCSSCFYYEKRQLRKKYIK